MNPRSARTSPIPNSASSVTITPAINPLMGLLLSGFSTGSPKTLRSALIEYGYKPLIRLQPPCPLDQITNLRQEAFLLRRRKRNGRVERRNPHHRAIEL